MYGPFSSNKCNPLRVFRKSKTVAPKVLPGDLRGSQTLSWGFQYDFKLLKQYILIVYFI